ncbi:MAG: hypothetical protein IPL51_06910 [Candidatus Competibacteraceae bacterium]|nr:hypothetical protein [Candidatus Competibacteraceae bacterium]
MNGGSQEALPTRTVEKFPRQHDEFGRFDPQANPNPLFRAVVPGLPRRPFEQPLDIAGKKQLVELATERDEIRLIDLTLV